MRTSWNFHSAGQLVFGRGAVSHLGSLISRRKLNRIFVVADERLAAAGLVDHIAVPLREAKLGFDLFQGGEPEPAIKTAITAAEAAREFRPDCILGLGGGSNMD